MNRFSLTAIVRNCENHNSISHIIIVHQMRIAIVLARVVSTTVRKCPPHTMPKEINLLVVTPIRLLGVVSSLFFFHDGCLFFNHCMDPSLSSLISLSLSSSASLINFIAKYKRSVTVSHHVVANNGPCLDSSHLHLLSYPVYLFCVQTFFCPFVGTSSYKAAGGFPTYHNHCYRRRRYFELNIVCVVGAKQHLSFRLAERPAVVYITTKDSYARLS